jgi:hypothetical protein
MGRHLLLLCLPTATAQEPDDLFEVISQCLLSAVDRDALSGWGGVVTVMYVVSLSAGSFAWLTALRCIAGRGALTLSVSLSQHSFISQRPQHTRGCSHTCSEGTSRLR